MARTLGATSLTNDERQQIVEMAMAGTLYVVIAERMGLNPNTVAKHARAIGIRRHQPDPSGRRRKTLTEPANATK
jgi:transposase-like protein